MGTPPMLDQGSTPRFPRGHRWGNRERQGLPERPRPFPTAPGVADSRLRVSPVTNDQRIRREATPWIPRPTAIPAGTGRASWYAAGPARPGLMMRTATMSPRSGVSRSRFMTDPRDWRLGLHTTPVTRSYGTDPRYKGQPAMSRRRQNRLSDARYTGQSYSQTTQTQGGRG